MKKSSGYIVVLVLSCCASSWVFGQQRPSFSRQVVGHVWNRERNPVAGAKVCATPQGGLGTRLSCGKSQVDGAFTIDIAGPGILTISAEDPVAGYPPAWNAFFGTFFGELPEIEVTKTNVLEPVNVIVGPKAGKVVFTIVDYNSRKPIESGMVKTCRADKPKICMSTSIAFPHGRYEMLTPEVPFTVGFHIWAHPQRLEPRRAFDETGTPLILMTVDLGERKEITVRLRRVPRHGHDVDRAGRE